MEPIIEVSKATLYWRSKTFLTLALQKIIQNFSLVHTENICACIEYIT